MSNTTALPKPIPSKIVCATYPKSGVLVELEYKEYRGLSEELVIEVIRTWLGHHGYSVTSRKKSQKGPDLEAFAPTEKTLVLEAKGEGSRPEMFRNYFLAALGQIVLRMNGSGATYVVALPSHEKYVSLVRKVPPPIRKKLGLEFWLVQPVTGILDYHIGVLKSDAE